MWLHAVHFRTVPYRTRTFNMPVRYGTRKQRTVHPPYTYIRNLCMVRYGTEGFVHYPLYGSKNVRYGTVRFDNVRYVEPSLLVAVSSHSYGCIFSSNGMHINDGSLYSRTRIVGALKNGRFIFNTLY